MSKYLMAIVAAGVGLGLSTAIVNSADAAQAPRSWSDFKVMVKKCDQLTGAERKQCMADARDAYRASNYNCESMSQPDRTQCQRYYDQWKSAAASDSKPAVTHTDEPTMTPATPGDPSPSERNRDSTKQQEDAAGNLPEPKPQNQ
jgi:hypothetical protein